MGKTTRFHPVSLPIIRENARQGGFILGRVHAEELSADRLSARYTIEIRMVPQDVDPNKVNEVWLALNNCYAADVQVSKVWIARSGVLKAELYTTVNPLNVDRSFKKWLRPLDEEEILEALDKMSLGVDETDWLLVDESEAAE